MEFLFDRAPTVSTCCFLVRQTCGVGSTQQSSPCTPFSSSCFPVCVPGRITSSVSLLPWRNLTNPGNGDAASSYGFKPEPKALEHAASSVNLRYFLAARFVPAILLPCHAVSHQDGITLQEVEQTRGLHGAYRPARAPKGHWSCPPAESEQSQLRSFN